MNQVRNVIALPSGTMLEGYRILDVLGAGGFGITYLAEEVAIGRKVASKEYLPGELATRARDGDAVTPIDRGRAQGFAWGLRRFIDEARTLARFEHPNIVTVFAFFKANGTAYYAMRYVEGEPLDRIVPVGTVLEETRLRAILLPLLNGLEAVHAAGFLHRDIKPANIFVRADGSPILIDFGSARMALSGHTKTLTAVLSPGYAPFEQYHADGGQGPWTDLYALGATLYRCVTGATPSEATQRVNARARNRPDPLLPARNAAKRSYDPALLAAIDAALRLNEEDRPQSVSEFRAQLDRQPMAADAAPASTMDAPGGQTLIVGIPDGPAREDEERGAAEDTMSPPEATGPVPARRRGRRLALAAASLALLCGGAVWAYSEYVVPSQRAEEEAKLKAAREATQRAANDAARRKAEKDRLHAEAQLPRQCDRLAAVEFDPANAGAVRGVALEKIDAAGALSACQDAVARFPDENRFKVILARAHVAAQRYAEALEILRPLAASGDSAAEVLLGFCHESGFGVPKDEAEAVRLYRSAADRNNPRAQHAIGVAYLNGRGMAKDEAEAMRWFRKAADLGFALAQYVLGLGYASGTGIAKNDVEAVQWYQSAANQGYPPAQYDLGVMYHEGRGVPRSDVEAVRWYRAAAEQGLAAAQYNLGAMYFHGRGVAQSDAEAARWYRSAADQGLAVAQLSVGFMYFEGRGVAKNEPQGVRWFRLAAEQGNAEAQFNMGWVYRNGRGVAADREQAIAWLRRAAAQGNEQARKALQEMGAAR